ncbi:hypothetical protein WICMUC_000168 [Wickerhamomyces mucosus]|uniref:Major facilitator superfamily (MFS) profile domain-containing protein n=1 Tax=Wickerhamomyces mucosus TaxID=1378264 RepID=A0A9P8Q086_9ASCO|nr:hypothetical protein WICMUC_000168 [Wickerhamomyces mucosus]
MEVIMSSSTVNDENESTSIYNPDQLELQNIQREVTRQLSKSLTNEEISHYEVELLENDIENISKRISYYRKWLITIILSITSVVVTMLSSCWSMASEKIIEHFGISREVSVLGISLYIWGLGVGPLFLSPISEFYGRKLTYIFGLSLCSCFQILSAFSPNIGGLLFGRFMSGFFGSAFLSVAGGTVTDIFQKNEIGVAMTVFSLAPFIGPALGPVISVFVVENIYFRWIFYILLITSGLMILLIILIVPETYKPVLLIKKAKRIRNETKDDKYFAPLEIALKEQSVWKNSLYGSKRPFTLLIYDRMMFILCFYTGLLLAIIYLFFVALPYIFRTVFKFSPYGQGLSFLGLLIGSIIGALPSQYFQSLYNIQSAKIGKLKPEFRLYPLLIGSFVVPIGLFIFAWTSYSNIHWIAPMIGCSIFSAGVALAFQGIFGYTADAYRLYAASGMACNSIMRSTMAGIFPLFGLQMYEKLGANWGSCLLALLTVVMIPFPFIFYKIGEKLRSKSPYTWSMD